MDRRVSSIMKLIIICCILVVTSAKEPSCEGVHVNGKFHKKVFLAKGLNRPYHLSFDKSEKRVFFSFNTGDDDEDTFQIGYLKEGQEEHKVMKIIENGFATAIDEHHRMAYFGGSKGIYELSLHKNGNLTKILEHHNIWDIFHKHDLYFISFPGQRLYKVKSTKTHKHKAELQNHIHEKIYQYAIDGDEDTFITNSTGLYEIKNGTHHRISYEGPSIFRAIEINNKGKAHFSGRNGIYVPNKHNHTLIEIAQIKNIFGLTFDEDDNIIYSNPHQIVKLLPEDCK